MRQAREQIGLTRQQLARDIGVTYGAIQHLETGATKSSKFLIEIAAALNVSPDWLKTGEERSQVHTSMDDGVAVVGYVGAGGGVYPIDDHEKGAGLDHVPPPLGIDKAVACLVVRGDSMYPAMDDGWLIFYSREHDGIDADALGRLSVCRLVDGRLMVKRVFLGRCDNRFTLESHNAATMHDIELEWVAPVLDIRPR